MKPMVIPFEYEWANAILRMQTRGFTYAVASSSEEDTLRPILQARAIPINSLRAQFLKQNSSYPPVKLRHMKGPEEPLQFNWLNSNV